MTYPVTLSTAIQHEYPGTANFPSGVPSDLNLSTSPFAVCPATTSSGFKQNISPEVADAHMSWLYSPKATVAEHPVPSLVQILNERQPDPSWTWSIPNVTLTCVELSTCADRILQLGVQDGTSPVARFAPVKVRVKNPHCPTQNVTGWLTDVS